MSNIVSTSRPYPPYRSGFATRIRPASTRSRTVSSGSRRSSSVFAARSARTGTSSCARPSSSSAVGARALAAAARSAMLQGRRLGLLEPAAHGRLLLRLGRRGRPVWRHLVDLPGEVPTLLDLPSDRLPVRDVVPVSAGLELDAVPARLEQVREEELADPVLV